VQKSQSNINLLVFLSTHQVFHIICHLKNTQPTHQVYVCIFWTTPSRCRWEIAFGSWASQLVSMYLKLNHLFPSVIPVPLLSGKLLSFWVGRLR